MIMRRLVIFISFLVTLALQSQNTSYEIRENPYSTYFINTFSILQEILGQERGAAVIVVSQNTKGAKTALSDILSDDRILPFSIRDIAVTHSDDGIGKTIHDLQEWKDNETRWVFIDSRGEVTASGVNFPTREDILKAIDDANLRPRLEILRQFIRQNPDILEARMGLLYELRKIGDIRAFRALKLTLPVISEIDETIGFPGIQFSGNDLMELPEDDSLSLEYSQDEDIWEEYIRIFNTLMPELLPLQSALEYTIDKFIPFSLPFSARLKKSANSLSTIVEEALQREPSNETLWKLWIALKPTRSIASLLDSLTPGPFTSENAWPPPSAKVAYIAYCRDNKDWGKIIDLTEPAWNEIAGFAALGQGTSLLIGSIWAELAEPLLESLLATNRIADAEQIINIWSQNSKWGSAFIRAARIAKRHGFDGISAKWEKINIGE